MSELGALLELIHNAHMRVSTFEAEYRDWIRPRRSLELHVERSELGEVHARWGGAGPFPTAISNTRRIWLKAPDSLRVEIMYGSQLVRLGVLNGERWWRWDPDWGGISGELVSDHEVDSTPPPPLLTPLLINPARLLATLHFEPIGSAVRVGRNVITALALPRSPSSTAPAPRYEFDFDAQHGTILRRAALEDRQVVSLTEATAVGYDGLIEPQHFVFTSPDGQPVRAVRPQALTPQAAAGQQSTGDPPPTNGQAARTSMTKRKRTERTMP